MFKPISLSFLASCLLLAGCGEKKADSDADTKAPGAVTQKTDTSPTLKEGWKEVKTAGFALAVPNDWTPVDLTASDIDKIIDEAAGANEGVKMQAAQFKQLASSGMVKLMVFGKVDPAGPFAENLNVVVTDSPGVPTSDQIAEAYKAQIAPMAVPGSTPSGGAHKLPVADGAKMKSELKITSGKATSVASLAYMFAKDGKMYTVTFSSLPGRAADVEKMADEVMQSFKTN